MTNEELVAEARRRYPIGSKVKQLWDSSEKGRVLTIQRHENIYKSSLPDEVWFHGGIDSSHSCVYLKGEWAETVSETVTNNHYIIY